MERYVDIVTSAENNYYWTWFLYNLLTNMVTISGVLIASLISLNDIVSSPNILFWLTWSLSIGLTLANKWLYSYNIHKKYVLGVIMLEKYYSEGWSFVSGVGRYSRYTDYDSRFRIFASRVEKIKLKSLENAPDTSSVANSSDIIATGPKQDNVGVSENSEVIDIHQDSL